jgi:hypothetical protein
MELNLTLMDRIFLANQYRILAALYPDEAEFYETARTAMERGYANEYGEVIGYFSEEMTANESRMVIDIVDMYRHLKESYDSLPDKTGISADKVRFPGFDGNDETESHYATYVRYMVERDNKWSELKGHNGDFNSHAPMTPTYRGMLNVHQTKDEVIDQRRDSQHC